MPVNCAALPKEQQTQGNVAQAARMLGTSRGRIYRALQNAASAG